MRHSLLTAVSALTIALGMATATAAENGSADKNASQTGTEAASGTSEASRAATSHAGDNCVTAGATTGEAMSGASTAPALSPDCVPDHWAGSGTGARTAGPHGTSESAGNPQPSR